MSKQRIAIISLSVTVFWMSAFLIVQESPKDAYKRGYLEGEAQVYTLWKEGLVELLDILYAKGYILPDSTAWNDSKIYRWPYIDSTDTIMRIHPDAQAESSIDWDTIPFNDTISDSLRRLYFSDDRFPVILFPTDSIDTMAVEVDTATKMEE